MADEMIVEPLAAAAPVAAVEPLPTEPPEPVAAPKSALPDELLKIPAMQAITAGQPAAFSASLAEFKSRPEAKQLLDNKDALLKSGFGLYRSLDGLLGVLFNRLHIADDEIKAADAAGKLLEIAPPFDVVSEAVSKSGGDNPVLSAKSPGAFKSAPVPAPVAAPTGAAPSQPASVQKATANARSRNLQPGAPTSGPVAGQGRLLTSILRPVL